MGIQVIMEYFRESEIFRWKQSYYESRMVNSDSMESIAVREVERSVMT